jgi:hypothetical protein
MTDDFNKWWDEDDLTTEGNNFVYGTPAYWAWEGWCAGAKAEREACAKVVEDSQSYDWHKFACETAFAIRARGNT